MAAIYSIVATDSSTRLAVPAGRRARCTRAARRWCRAARRGHRVGGVGEGDVGLLLGRGGVTAGLQIRLNQFSFEAVSCSPDIEFPSRLLVTFDPF